jgi:hypothetical protein
MGVLDSTELGKIIIKRDYKDLKNRYPDWSEKEILTFLLYHENKHMRSSGTTEVMTDDQIAEVMCKIKSLDDFCDFVAELECRENPLLYENEIAQEIESIIKNEQGEALSA